MKTHTITILTISALLPILSTKAEEMPPMANPALSEVHQVKEDIRRQEVILRALKDRLSTIESKNQKEETFIVNLVGGQAVLMGAEVSLKQIELALREKAEISASYPIVIRADETTPYSAVVGILELSKKAGLSNVACATPKK